MKKIIAGMLTVLLLIPSLAGCGALFDNDAKTTQIKIGVMNGPTGMGMAKLIADEAENPDTLYTFESFSSPNDAVPKLTNGTLDMLCLPTNTAATLSSKLDISVIAINCLGSLYLMSDAQTTVTDLSDLEGKTIYCSVPTSTTQPILAYILSQAGVNATVECVADHDALVAKIAKNEVQIAVLPEPKASAALTKNPEYAIDLNISDEWSKLSAEPLTMGCIVVRNEFLEDHTPAVDAFLGKYKSSIEYINNKSNLDSSASMITDAGIIPQATTAKKALNNLYGSIIYIDGQNMKDALISFFNAIGQALPDEDLYYVK